jgi:glycosyltransferase involved in cell wall biosynthesis
MPQVNPNISVVAPCYNEGPVVRIFYDRVVRVLAGFPGQHQIVLVDDGSSDDTWNHIQTLHSADPRVCGVRLSRNFGHQPALSAGFDAATGDVVFVLDADLQDPPELLEAMLQRWRAGAMVVYGQRRKRRDTGFIKRVCYVTFYRILAWLSDYPIPLDTGDFRLMDRRVVEVVRSMPEHQRFLRGMISWVGFRQEALAYDRDGRIGGEPKYTFQKLFQLATDGIMSFSIKPLRVAIWLASAAALGALALMGYVLFALFIMKSAPQGWTSLMVVVLLTSSAQLLVLGIVGEYLGRVFLQGKNRPMYVVGETLGTAQNPGQLHGR